MDAEGVISELSRSLQERGLTLAVAESLTCGALASAIGAGDNASDWFRGGVVAYMDDVKFTVLGVPEGPVVTAECAAAMASGVRRLLAADLAVAVTGVGGPGAEEGQPPGTVYLALADARGVRTRHERFDGDPEAVMRQTVDAAIALVLEG